MGNNIVTFEIKTEQRQRIDLVDRIRLFGELYIEVFYDSFEFFE